VLPSKPKSHTRASYGPQRTYPSRAHFFSFFREILTRPKTKVGGVIQLSTTDRSSLPPCLASALSRLDSAEPHSADCTTSHARRHPHTSLRTRHTRARCPALNPLTPTVDADTRRLRGNKSTSLVSCCILCETTSTSSASPVLHHPVQPIATVLRLAVVY
jgi:hypothetical protein